MKEIRIDDIQISNDKPFVLIAGLNVLEEEKVILEVISKCKENGLLLVSCGEFGNVIRFMGPLTTPIKQVEEALGIFSESLI